MKKQIFIIVFLLIISPFLDINAGNRKFPQVLGKVDAIFIQQPVFVTLLDVNQDYVMSYEEMVSLCARHEVLNDSIMDAAGYCLCSFLLKLVYYSDSSEEEYNHFFSESLCADSVLDFNIPEFEIIDKIRSKNLQISKMTPEVNAFIRIPITGRDYNYFMYDTIIDGEISRPLEFNNLDEFQYIVFPVNYKGNDNK